MQAIYSMGQHKRRQTIFVVGFVLTGIFLSTALAWAVKDARPFWTEKSAFIEGDELFVVGIASKAKTPEEGRQQAFDRGKVELMNYAQATTLEAQGLVIETQMTFEEPNPDGTVTVFRLLRVPVQRLVAIQNRLQSQSRTQESNLEQSRRELFSIQESLARKQQELETRSRGIQETLESVSKLQVTLGEKSAKLDQQQRQVEELVRQITNRLATTESGTKGRPAKGATRASTLVDQLKDTEAKLDALQEQWELISQRARDRIKKEIEYNRLKCQLLGQGMVAGDVRALMGEPNTKYYDRWDYGTTEVIQIHWNRTGGVETIKNCNK